MRNEDEDEYYRVETARARRHRRYEGSCATPYCPGGSKQRCEECGEFNASCPCGACNETCRCAEEEQESEMAENVNT